MPGDHDDIRDRLVVISEDLADRAMDRLRADLADGATRASAEDKRLTRARRAVDKAVALLTDPAEADGYT